MDWEIAKPLLEAKLDPKHVKKPSGSFGPKGDYIEGWHAIAEANRIFGFGGWSYTIKTMTQDSLKEGTTAKGDTQWQAAYTCIVTVKVGDVVREDVGFGSGFAKQIGDAVEGATKEAVTDALKRTLRTFGSQFGLALYDKSRENVGVTPIPFDATKTRDRIKAAIANAADEAALDKVWAHTATKTAISKLTEAMQDDLARAYSNRMGEVAA
tara:strand:- start:6 stop:638 length:633 start_codon:yes stop_codon:yes gene_type:complete